MLFGKLRGKWQYLNFKIAFLFSQKVKFYSQVLQTLDCLFFNNQNSYFFRKLTY